jgi:MoxR-like ATPase
VNYKRKYFDPEGSRTESLKDGSVVSKPQDEKEDLYIFAPKVILALEVAIVTGRPLLVSGEPGCGKSSLARSAAAVLGWRYYHRTVTSRTQAADLLWMFDALRRLNDASKQSATLLPDQHYIEPGPLWWAFNPKTAAQRGSKPLAGGQPAADPGSGPDTDAAVVLIDEIDKADPDVPNDLLEPFDRKTFTVRETGDQIASSRQVLMILTTNRERTMPRAFVRRCVTLDLDTPTQDWLVDIARRRYGASEVHTEVAAEVMALREHAAKLKIRQPSTAEYLDAVIAAAQLDADRSSNEWTEVKRALLWKSEQPMPEGKSA